MALLPINQYFENDDRNKGLSLTIITTISTLTTLHQDRTKIPKICEKKSERRKLLSLAVEMILSDYDQIFSMQTINELPKSWQASSTSKEISSIYKQNEAYSPKKEKDIADLALKQSGIGIQR